MQVELEERKAWSKNGDPRYKAQCVEKVSCSNCGKIFDDGDYCYISDVIDSFYCRDCSLPRASDIKDGEKKIATKVQVDYSVLQDEDLLREQVRNQYEEMGFNPDNMEDDVEQEVQRRLGNL